MKRILMLLTLTISLFGAYEVGDVVENLSWKDSDGGEPVERSLYDLISSKKVVLIDYSTTTCGPCNAEAPELEHIYNLYGGAAGPLHIVATIGDTESWDQLNGYLWRTKFDPQLTYALSIGSELYTPYYDLFGNGYVPYNVIIGNENKVVHTGSGFNHDQFIELIDTALSTFFNIYVVNPIEDIELTGGESTTIDLSEVFGFREGSGDVEISISYNSNPSLVTAELNGDILSISTDSSVGTAKITITGECDGEVIPDQFEVKVVDNNAQEIFVEGFEEGNQVNHKPAGWTHEIFPPFNYFPFWCANSNYPAQGTAPHSDQWYIFMDNTYSEDPQNRAEGWMYKAIELEAGVDYRVGFWAMSDCDSDQYELKISCGTAPNRDSMTMPIIESEDVVIGVCEHMENAGEFSVETSGTYYLGLYGKQNGDETISKYMSLDDIALYKLSDIEENLQSDIQLYQNYPNPFNPVTSIMFSLANSGKVELSVYNSSGALIKELIDREMVSGTHNIEFDGTSLASGVYYYQLRGENMVISRKMVLMK
jgi:thiol-disulfide isomerase/thioredoxin